MSFKKTLWLSLAFTSITAFGLLFTAQTRSQGNGNGQDHEAEKPEVIHRPNPNSHTPGFALTTGSNSAQNPGIVNHGGPTVDTPVIYLIWYGNWAQNNGSDTAAGQQIVRDFANNINGSSYFQINQTYGISGNTVFGGETTDLYSKGSALTDANIQSIVSSAISSGGLPYNTNGVYFVLTSSDVTETSGFCTQYCGWHTYGTINPGKIRYSFVGNANRCLGACAAQSTSPNGNAGVDGMISVIAHELEEAATDPDLNAWYDRRGYENADKCAWTFGHFQYQVGNGSWANLHLGARDYLIQRNLKASDNKCYIDLTHQ